MELNALFNTTMKLMEKSLDLRAKNQNIISANLANAETPGYIPSKLSFEGELKDAIKSNGQAAKSTTNPRHIPLKGQASGLDAVRGSITESPDGSVGYDGNGVELEEEMGRLAENQILYNATIQLAAKKFEGLKTAIKGSF